MYAKLLITNKSKEDNVQYIFCVADDYQKVVETHHLGSPSALKTLCLVYTCRIHNNIYLEVGHRGSIIIKTKE